MATVGGFLALILREPSLLPQELADDCVREFDSFRAGPSSQEIECRRSAGLTQRQSALLLQRGYAYVLEEWRFHMTLTGRLAPAERDRLLVGLRPLAEPHCRNPRRVDAMTLCAKPAPGRQFARFAR